MPISIAGSGTITGISAGGLPDDCITTAEIAAGAVTRPKIGYAGAILQVVNYQTGAVATGTTTLPFDNSTPQNTEGTQYMTLAITPTSSSSKLIISVKALFTFSVADNALTVALFQDSTANALASTFSSIDKAGYVLPFVISHYMTAGTTSATTFKVRAGSDAAGTTTFNGSSGSGFMNGTFASNITITEIAT
jgi:hypothetical protein